MTTSGPEATVGIPSQTGHSSSSFGLARLQSEPTNPALLCLVVAMSFAQARNTVSLDSTYTDPHFMICTFCNGAMSGSDSECPHCKRSPVRRSPDDFWGGVLEILSVVSFVVLVASPFAGLALWLAETPDVFAITLCGTLISWLARSYFKNRVAGQPAGIGGGVTAYPDDGQEKKLFCDAMASVYLFLAIGIYMREFVRVFYSL